MNCQRIKASVASCVVAFGLAGCSDPVTELCSTDAPEGLNRAPHLSIIYNGSAEPHPVCEVNGSALQEGHKYSFPQGLLIINGDVPARSALRVGSGRIVISGDVGESSRVDATLPETFRTRTQIVMMPVPTGNGISMQPRPQTQRIFDGFAYPDDLNPSVKIEGYVERNAVISGNRSVEINAADPSVKVSVSRQP